MGIAEIIAQGVAWAFVGFLHAAPYIILYALGGFVYYCFKFVQVWLSEDYEPTPDPKPEKVAAISPASPRKKVAKPRKPVVSGYSDDFKLPANPFGD